MMQIAEYRALRAMMDRVGGWDIFTDTMKHRIEHLNDATWPQRNRELKTYNDSLFEYD